MNTPTPSPGAPSSGISDAALIAESARQSAERDRESRVSGAGSSGGGGVLNTYPYVEAMFMARITGWATLGATGARWKYAWELITLDGDDDSLITGDLARSGTTGSDYALNITELNNVTQGSGTQGNSVDDSAADYSGTGFSIQPVGGGSGGTPDNQVPVVMHVLRDANGNRRYVFEYQNADDGAC